MARRGITAPAETFAAGLSDRILHCRELGHNWRPNTVTYDRKSRSYDRTLRCTNCRTVRHQVLDSSGDVVRNGYTYPDGYLAHDIERGSYSRAVFRLESVVRSITPREERQAS
jgi:hypothetical protein